MIGKYLDDGGKVLIQEDPISEKSQQDPGLESIYQPWNMNVGTNVVVDVSGVGRFVGTGPAAPVVIDYGDNPITKNLKGGMTFFPGAHRFNRRQEQGGPAGYRAAENFSSQLHDSESRSKRS